MFNILHRLYIVSHIEPFRSCSAVTASLEVQMSVCLYVCHIAVHGQHGLHGLHVLHGHGGLDGLHGLQNLLKLQPPGLEDFFSLIEKCLHSRP